MLCIAKKLELMGVQKVNGKIARIENSFIENAQYSLTVNEQKTILYLIAGIDPTKKNFERIIVPVKGLETMLKESSRGKGRPPKETKWGSLYDRMQDLADNISQKRITFISEVMLEGRPFKGYINWFSHVLPTYDKHGEVCIEFEFAPVLKEFLLSLKQFVQIDRTEIADMTHFSSIRLYQLFKAIHQKQAKYKKVVGKVYEVDELKRLLNLEGKYKEYKNFSQKVLNPALKEINEQTSLCVEVIKRRNSQRKITALEFKISSKTDIPTQLSLLRQSLQGKRRHELPKKELERRLKKFNYDAFQRRYAAQYKAIKRNVRQRIPADMDSSAQAFQTSLYNACETWFVENIAL